MWQRRILLRLCVNTGQRQCRRLGSSASLPPQPPEPTGKPPSILERVKDKLRVFFMHVSSDNSVAFDEAIIRSVSRADKVDLTQWNLVYNDFDTFRIGMVGSLSIAALSLSACAVVADLVVNGEPTLGPVKTIMFDAEELGVFACIPFSLMVVVLSLLLRIHFLRIYRIYQSYADPTKFVVVHPALFNFTKQIPVSRSAIRVLPTLYTDEKNLVSLAVTGNAMLGPRKALVNIEAFKSMPYKSYVTGEIDRLPRDFAQPPKAGSGPGSARKKPPAPPPF